MLDAPLSNDGNGDGDGDFDVDGKCDGDREGNGIMRRGKSALQSKDAISGDRGLTP